MEAIGRSRRGRGPNRRTLAAVALIVAGIASAVWAYQPAIGDWGPLLVDKRVPSSGYLEPYVPGVVHFTEHCSYLVAEEPMQLPSGETPAGSRALIAWPESLVTWDGTTRSIRYGDGSDPIIISEGDRVVFGQGFYFGSTQVQAVAGLPVSGDCPVDSPIIVRGVLVPGK